MAVHSANSAADDHDSACCGEGTNRTGLPGSTAVGSVRFAWRSQLSLENNTTLERVRQILAKEFEVASELIQPAARLDQLAIDSLAVIDVMFQLEDEFEITFPQDPGQMPTVGDLAACIDRLVVQQRARASSGAATP